MWCDAGYEKCVNWFFFSYDFHATLKLRENSKIPTEKCLDNLMTVGDFFAPQLDLLYAHILIDMMNASLGIKKLFA